MQNFDIIKIYSVNTFAVLASFTAINDGIKFSLLLVSLVYTAVKTIILIRDNFNKDHNDDEKNNK